MTDTADLKSDMLFESAASTPEHIEQAVRSVRNLDSLPDREKIEHVVVLGMGSSGIAGDVLLATAAPFMPVPVTVVKSYELPAFVGEGSLVFAISLSGNTEETIDAATDAAVQGARVVVVTQGGHLGELAGGWGAPIVRVPKTVVNARAALGALAIPPIAVLEQIGLFPGATQWIDLAVEQLKRRRDELQKPNNTAERIAENLVGKMSVIHGGGELGSAAAQRWKCQINANAKAPAFWSSQPELSHNEASAWDSLSEMTKRDVAVVSLRHEGEHPQVTRRFELVNEHLRPNVASLDEVHAEGDGELAQLFDLVMLGDYVSLHLAARSGVDPGPLPFLAMLKSTLSDA